MEIAELQLAAACRLKLTERLRYLPLSKAERAAVAQEHGGVRAWKSAWRIRGADGQWEPPRRMADTLRLVERDFLAPLAAAHPDAFVRYRRSRKRKGRPLSDYAADWSMRKWERWRAAWRETEWNARRAAEGTTEQAS